MVTTSGIASEVLQDFLYLLIATSVASIALNYGIQPGDPLYTAKIAIANMWPGIVGVIVAVPTVGLAVLDGFDDGF